MTKIKQLAACVAAGLVAAGCAAWAQTSGGGVGGGGSGGNPHQCNPNTDCAITVVVNGDGGACTITDPGDYEVGKDQNPNLIWSIQNSGSGQYKFAAGGIAFNNKADPVPNGEFTDKGVQNDGTYKIKDNNKQKRTNPAAPPKRYNYKITVMKSDDSFGCDKDPVVINDGCDTTCP